jgi:hypothetical protein
MLKLIFKRLAIDKVPESWGSIRNGAPQALTGLEAGQVLSPERKLLSVDVLGERGRQHLCVRQGERAQDSTGSETLSMLRNNLRENREIPWLTSGAMPLVRIEKSKDARR